MDKSKYTPIRDGLGMGVCVWAMGEGSVGMGV